MNKELKHRVWAHSRQILQEMKLESQTVQRRGVTVTGFAEGEIGVQISTLPFPSLVILGKEIKDSMAQFPHQ